MAARWTAADYHYPTDYDGTIADRNAQQVEHRLTASVDLFQITATAATETMDRIGATFVDLIASFRFV